MIERERFVAAVRSCIFTPVAHMGRTIGRGLDCVGVPYAAAREVGVDLQPTRSYGLLPSESDLADGLAAYCDRVADPADAHIWQVRSGRQARHVVVPVGLNGCGQPLVVHAWGRNRKVVEAVWVEPVAAYWRIRGIE